MNICKSVNEVSKWDNFYNEYTERLTEVSKQFPQASSAAVTNIKNIPIVSDITSGAIARFQNRMADKSPNFKRILHSRSQSHFQGIKTYQRVNIKGDKKEPRESTRDLNQDLALSPPPGKSH